MIRSNNGARAVAFIAALMAVFFFTTVNQAHAGTVGTPTGTGVGGAVDGTIAGNPRHQSFAGLMEVTIDGTETFAYCIDIHNGLQFNQPHEEGDWSESNVANLPKITRILRQHPADGTAARNDAVEAAAVQAAIWHFSDGFNLTGGAPGVVDATTGSSRTRTPIRSRSRRRASSSTRPRGPVWPAITSTSRSRPRRPARSRSSSRRAEAPRS